MEPKSLQYSTKNIPVPSRKLYYETLITKVKKFVHRGRWKAYFTLNPNKKPKQKQNYGFKSTAAAPFVTQMKFFEDKLADLVKNVKFNRKPNKFQQTLKKDAQKIMMLKK